MRLKYYKVTEDYIIRFFTNMSIEDYLYKYYGVCERARLLNMPVWEFVIMKINEGVFTYRGIKVKLNETIN